MYIIVDKLTSKALVIIVHSPLFIRPKLKKQNASACYIAVKIGYQSCVYATAMHTELELSTLSAVRVVNRQL